MQLQPRQIKYSTRVSQRQSYLQHYQCNSAISTQCYSIENHLSSAKISPFYSAFLANVSSTYEPSFYHQAVQYPEWRATMRATMNDELQAMENNKTWSIVPLPEGKQAIEWK
ncbi:cysteine-rich RLK (RECEPTOR-like protein kinase) 8 [Hibiscus trionum]|uniref:Cysteine-rich RLK (RECEPTOR-like protein kinase) 8 n=1 Tax=Hibiscus trionum TaxID=183268 RepID=A0A9W7I5E4_HIBTR|nr:cysteine-rich RLK (RECEPTOR-like protein kinase) 8 [Hibiscus trionum]